MADSAADAVTRAFDEVKVAIRDLAASLRAEINSLETGLRAEMKTMESGLRAEMKAMESSLRAEMAAGFAEMRADSKSLEARLQTQFMWLLGGIGSATIALMIAIYTKG